MSLKEGYSDTVSLNSKKIKDIGYPVGIMIEIPHYNECWNESERIRNDQKADIRICHVHDGA